MHSKFWLESCLNGIVEFDGQLWISLIGIYYKQREKPGLVGMLEKNVQNHISGFVADFGRFAHISYA